MNSKNVQFSREVTQLHAPLDLQVVHNVQKLFTLENAKTILTMLTLTLIVTLMLLLQVKPDLAGEVRTRLAT